MTPATQTPLEATVERVAALSELVKVEVGTPEGDGWFTPAELLTESTLLDTLWTHTSAGAKTTDRGYLKQSVFGSYSWLLSVSGLGTYLLERRVPDLSAHNTALHMDENGWIDRLAFLKPRFACLPDDPAVNDPHATVVRDVDELRRYYLRVLIDEHLGAFMGLMKLRFQYGSRAMQETLADRIAGTLIWLLEGDNARVRTEVKGFLELLPYKTKTGVLEVPYGGRREPLLKRASCCLSYKLPDYGLCTSCPLQPKSVRTARFQAYLAGETG